MDTTNETKDYRFQPDQIDWNSLSSLGIDKGRLEKIDVLDNLLKGYKTNELVPLTLKLGNAVVRMDARLSLQQNDEGKIVMAMHGIRREPNLNFSFFGHEFTDEDKENLRRSGNMGRVVELYNQKSGEYIPSVISIDSKTKELVAFRADWMKVPEEIKGVKLNEEQKQVLLEGKPLYLEGMISKKGEPFNAEVQFNADKRFIEFLFGERSTVQKKANGDLGGGMEVKTETKEAKKETKKKKDESAPKIKKSSKPKAMKL